MALTEEHLAALLADEAIPVAHRALWSLLRDGVRLEEALCLDVRDIDVEALTATIDYRKLRADPPTEMLASRTIDLLQRVFDGRTEGPALQSARQRPISISSASMTARRAGVSIHDFRHPRRRRGPGEER